MRGWRAFAEHCLEKKSIPSLMSSSLLLAMQPSSSSCMRVRCPKLPWQLLLLPALSHQRGGELCCMLGGGWQGWCSAILFSRLSLFSVAQGEGVRVLVFMCTPVCMCVHRSTFCDIATPSLCRVGQGRGGHHLVLPLYTGMGGREVLSVLDVGLTWTTLISIFAVPCSLEKEGK